MNTIQIQNNMIQAVPHVYSGPRGDRSKSKSKDCLIGWKLVSTWSASFELWKDGSRSTIKCKCQPSLFFPLPSALLRAGRQCRNMDFASTFPGEMVPHPHIMHLTTSLVALFLFQPCYGLSLLLLPAEVFRPTLKDVAEVGVHLTFRRDRLPIKRFSVNLIMKNLH